MSRRARIACVALGGALALPAGTVATIALGLSDWLWFPGESLGMVGALSGLVVAPVPMAVLELLRHARRDDEQPYSTGRAAGWAFAGLGVVAAMAAWSLARPVLLYRGWGPLLVGAAAACATLATGSLALPRDPAE